MTKANGRREYKLVKRHGHPIARSQGKVYLHRYVLYNAIGPGAHACHWCDRVVSWEDKTLTADHKDWDHLNNTPENLVPSCLPCNSRRYRDRDDRGERNPNAKLSDRNVLEILSSSDTQAALARKYGVTPALIWQIKRRRIWTHLSPATDLVEEHSA